MFKKNLDALKVRNPKLADILENISIDEIKDDFEVYQAESGDVILSYQGLALDDIYDPIRVAKTNWNMNVPNNLKPYDIIAIFGLGLGYLFKRAYISCKSRILLYEPKIEILRYVLEYVDFSNEISDKRVYFAENKADAMNFLTEKYLSDDNLVFLYPEPYAQLVTQEMSEYTNDIVEVCNLKKMDVNTIKFLAKEWAKHSLVNLTKMQNARPVTWLKNIFEGKTALVAAAGPSLKDNLSKIKENRDKLIIFSVNRAAATLLENDIKPDFVLFADVVSVKHTIEGIQEELNNCNIIADARANSIVFDNFSNILTYFSKNDLIAQHLANATDNAFELQETAGTAAAQAYYCAKLMGFKDIIFAGLDLAFKGDVIYADGQKAKIDENNQVPVGDSKVRKINVIKVKDINGNLVNTRDDYALFIRQFEDIFALDNSSKLYNISDFGAYIEGMNYTSLDTILENIKSPQDDISMILDEFRQNTNANWVNCYNKISNILKKEQNILENIKQKTALLLSKELEIMAKVSDISVEIALDNELRELSQEFSAFLPEILGDAFLSQYFQSEFVQFVSINNQSINQGREVFVNLKKFEIEILQGIIEICENWIEFLKEKLA